MDFLFPPPSIWFKNPRQIPHPSSPLSITSSLSTDTHTYIYTEMKSRIRGTCSRSSSSEKGDLSFYRYLKPGALAQIRDSKITAKSKKTLDLQFHMALCQITASTTAAESLARIPNGGDGIPCFSLRTKNPRCLQRKKLVAITPVFCETQIWLVILMLLNTHFFFFMCFYLKCYTDKM